MTTSTSYPAVFHAILKAEGGEDFIRWLLADVCGVLRSPMASSTQDIQYLCGKQDVGYILLPMLAEHSPHILAKLMETPDVS